MVSTWKKDKSYNKGKFEIKWSILKDICYFKIFNEVN